VGDNAAMVLVEFALLLKTALDAMRSSDRDWAAGSARGIRRWTKGVLRLASHSKEQSVDLVLLRVLRGRLGDTPEALNRFALVSHCAEAAKTVRNENVNEFIAAELVSAMLGYFMMHTVGPHTFGLIYSTESHPLLSLVEGSPESGFAIVNTNRKIVDAKMPGWTDRHPDPKRISTAILIVKDGLDADLFREQILEPLSAGVAANGIDILAVANTPEAATAVASAVPGRGKFQVVNFPFLESDLGLSGISLRCILST
jgi:hypothetical protein